jgi:glycosyltransferase involved in cell wall biosynthesis
MKIVQVSSGSAGIPPKKIAAHETVIFNTAKHLAKMGHEVVILDRKHSKDDLSIDCIEDVKIARLDVMQIRSGKARGLISFAINELNVVLFAIKVSDYLRRNRQNVDIINLHLTLIGAILVILNRGLREKMVYTCHIGQWTLANSRLNNFERIHLFIDSFLMKRVAKVIALNDIAKERFTCKVKIKANSIAVVPVGVDIDFFNDDIEVGEIVKRYGLEGKLTVLFVGRLAKIKGVKHLIEAANIIVNKFKYKDILFVLVGPHTFDATEKPIGQEEILSLIVQHQLEKYVTLTGILPLGEVRMLYVAADIFVLPSLSEGDPLVVPEAMASGKPIIGTKVGGIPQKVRDGWNGFLIDAGDEQQLAEKIRYLIDKPEERQRMGANSRRYAEEEFDWSRVAEKLLLVYQCCNEVNQTGFRYSATL